MKTINVTSPEVEKVLETNLLNFGYKSDFLSLCKEKDFTKFRWSLHEISILESIVGNEVKRRDRVIKITRVEVRLCSSMFFFAGGCFPVSKQKMNGLSCLADIEVIR